MHCIAQRTYRDSTEHALDPCPSLDNKLVSVSSEKQLKNEVAIYPEEAFLLWFTYAVIPVGSKATTNVGPTTRLTYGNVVPYFHVG